MKDFKNKVAAITGAASGMGRTLALELARRGCHLALSDVNETGLAETAAQFAPALVVIKELEGYLRGREPGEVPSILRAALLRAGLPGEALKMQSTELDAVRCALEWGRPGDVLALPVHGLAARAAVVEMLRA